MNTRLFTTLLVALLFSPVSQADTNPTEGLVNYESPHVHPMDLTPDQNTLLAVNTAGHRLEIYDVSGGGMAYQGFVPVGIDPVSVRARSNTEAWVVNHISDSVSIIDLRSKTVIRTLSTANEPADVAFAGNPKRAFVSASEANRVQVFDLNNLNATPTAVFIAGEDPRELAVSPDGNTVYAAIFESGNGTTALSGGASVIARDAVSRPEGPYGGQNPPPNNGTQFNPPINPAIGTPPKTALIVRKDDQGRWKDDNNGDWTQFISGPLATVSSRVEGWDLPDNDVAIINANTLAVSYQKRLMNMVMAMAVNPASGQVNVVGTDASNEVRFEPNLNGNFLRVNLAQFSPGAASSIRDMNPHLNYTQATVSIALREQSIGDPRGIAWNGNGSLALVTGMGSNNLLAIDAQGNRIGRIDVGEGPTGVVIQDGQSRAFVMNKFSGDISTVSLDPLTQTNLTGFDDPTPAVIKEGRKFLYDTHLTSGTGHLSCASCHVDARTDRLSWDLGNPAGEEAQVGTADNNTGAATGNTRTVSPMKGPLLTQTLQDIMLHPSLHWRGDRNNLAEFNSTFTNLMGLPQQLSGVDMLAMGDFLNTIHLPPNPYRNVDNTRPDTVTMPDGTVAKTTTFNALRGSNSRENNCLRCHMRSGTRNGNANVELGQAFIAPAFSPFYDRLGYWAKLSNGSTSGFGFFHDGAERLGGAVRSETAENQLDMLAEIMTLDGPGGPLTGGERRQDTHAGVGRQMTINGATNSGQRNIVNQLITIADTSPYAALIASGVVNGVQRGFFRTNGSFQSDRSGQISSLQDLLDFAASEQAITFTLVAEGTGRRMSVDRNNNGVLDGDENVVVNDPPVANPDSVSVTSSATFTIQPLGNDTGSGLILTAPDPFSLEGGNVTLSGNSLQYTPKPGFNGEDKIYYTINDSQGRSNWSVITITVSGNGGNNTDPLAANPDVVTATSAAQITIEPLSNDTGSGLVLQAPNEWSLQGGRVALAGNTLRYTPKPGFNGEDKIYYTINDAQGNSVWSEITINISGNGGGNDAAPEANPDFVDASGTISIQPLSNDTGNGITLQTPNPWSLQGGTVLASGNTLSYTPKPGFSGEDKIFYNIIDTQGRTNWSSVTITVNSDGGNAEVFPVAVIDSAATSQNTAVTIDVLVNDTGRDLSITDSNEFTVEGGKTIISDNKIVYTPPVGFQGTDSFWYVITDAQGRTNSTEVFATVNGGATSDFPTANGDTASTNRDTGVVINALANDTGTALRIDTANEFSQQGGTARIINNQLFFVPKAGFTGSDTFWYSIADDQGRTNSTMVTVTVN